MKTWTLTFLGADFGFGETLTASSSSLESSSELTSCATFFTGTATGFLTTAALVSSSELSSSELLSLAFFAGMTACFFGWGFSSSESSSELVSCFLFTAAVDFTGVLMAGFLDVSSSSEESSLLLSFAGFAGGALAGVDFAGVGFLGGSSSSSDES